MGECCSHWDKQGFLELEELISRVSAAGIPRSTESSEGIKVSCM